MKPRINGRSKTQKSKNVKGDGPSWMVVAGIALLSSLFIHLGYMMKQALESSTVKPADRTTGTSQPQQAAYTYGPVEDSYFYCTSGQEEAKSS